LDREIFRGDFFQSIVDIFGNGYSSRILLKARIVANMEDGIKVEDCETMCNDLCRSAPYITTGYQRHLAC